MVTRCAEPVWEQLSLFAPVQESPVKFPDLRMVGDIVGRLVLAECEEAMVTKVEGLPSFPFYRTSRGSCYSYEEGSSISRGTAPSGGRAASAVSDSDPQQTGAPPYSPVPPL